MPCLWLGGLVSTHNWPGLEGHEEGVVAALHVGQRPHLRSDSGLSESLAWTLAGDCARTPWPGLEGHEEGGSRCAACRLSAPSSAQQRVALEPDAWMFSTSLALLEGIGAPSLGHRDPPLYRHTFFGRP